MPETTQDLISLVLSSAVGALFGGITSYIVTRSSYSRERIYEVYTNVFFPLYMLLKNCIECPDEAVPPDEVEYYKKKATKLLAEVQIAYPVALYEYTTSLSPETFNNYCQYIKRNYDRCTTKLNNYAPYAFFGDKVKRVKIICVISTISTALILSLMLGLIQYGHVVISGFLLPFLIVAFTFSILSSDVFW